ncbi:MAG: hypothetical protein AAF211_33065 [Myxococcota bacterium]
MITLAATLFACTTPDPEETPLEGPGFDERSGAFVGEGQTFVVALSHLQVKNRPAPGGRFGDHAEAIGNGLFEDEPEGWLGAAFRNVGQLNWWTMSVWTDEAAMLQWVVDEPHSTAMRDFSEITVGGEFKRLEVTADELPMTWERAMWELFEEPDKVAGETRWFRDGDL